MNLVIGYALEVNHLDILQFLINKTEKINDWYLSEFIKSARLGNIKPESMKLIFEKLQNQDLCISIALKSGHPHIVKPTLEVIDTLTYNELKQFLGIIFDSQTTSLACSKYKGGADEALSDAITYNESTYFIDTLLGQIEQTTINTISIAFSRKNF
ncbi:MAG: hypothetical protein ACRYE8_03625 [Janthinobacterium lividum]